MRRALVVGIVVALATQLLGTAAAGAGSGRSEAARLPVEHPGRGVVVADLAVATDGPCEGLLEVLDVPSRACTHGPDPAPVEFGDVRTAQWDLAEAEETAAAAASFTCDGDGRSGRRAHAIYAVAPDRVDQFATYEAAFRGRIAEIQDEVRQSSLLHGATEPLVYRFTHTVPVDGTCEPLLDHVVLPRTTDDDSFSATISALQELGYTDPSRRYLVWVDANVLCGIATMYTDDDPAPADNANDRLSKPLFSRVDASCWGYAETHELVHNIGGVQKSAPNSSGAGHCNDDHDTMCYSDGGPLSALRILTGCGDKALWERRLDCGGDDYFHPSPPSGSYLATHWNTANSGWLFREVVASPTTGSGDTTTDDTTGGDDDTSPEPSTPPEVSWPAVVRDGTWHLREAHSSGKPTSSWRYGKATDYPFFGDWDGDGVATPGIYRNGHWYLRNSNSDGPADISFSYGGHSRDFPLVGDWNGDGKDTVGIIRGGEWHLVNTLRGGVADITFTYGRVAPRGTDIPLVGDWNGDGKDTVGIVREGEWHLRNVNSGGSGQIVFTYGRVGPRGDDIALVGDWDGDGDDSVGIVRGTTWHLRNTNTGGSANKSYDYGLVGDWKAVMGAFAETTQRRVL